MTDLQFLTWVRGPGLDIAVAVFVLGSLWRLIEIYALGRKTDLAPGRHRDGASGWHTVVRRFEIPQDMFKRAPLTYIGGYVFHLGLFVVVFLFGPHILLFESVLGLGWPALPSPVINLVTIITLAALLVVLWDRLVKPVKRFLSTFGDWLTWTLTFLPVLTGWLAVQHLLLPYTQMLALHILSVELLLVAIPFSKLIHVFTSFGSRWYNGAINGHRGVPV